MSGEECLMLWTFLVLKSCFDKSGWYFDNFVKNWLLQAFLARNYFRKMVMRHNLYPLRHQQNFLILLKLYCRYGHMTKIW